MQLHSPAIVGLDVSGGWTRRATASRTPRCILVAAAAFSLAGVMGRQLICVASGLQAGQIGPARPTSSVGLRSHGEVPIDHREDFTNASIAQAAFTAGGIGRVCSSRKFDGENMDKVSLFDWSRQ